MPKFKHSPLTTLSMVNPKWQYSLLLYLGMSILISVLPLTSTYSQATMVQDINPSGSSWIDHLTVYNNKLYFKASNGSSGEELWQYDGTTASLIADIRSGFDSSLPDDLVVYNNKLYFEADNGVNGKELWVYDGSSVSNVVDIHVGGGSASPTEMTVYNNKLYFSADDGTNGEELWVYDGTTASLVIDIRSGASSFPRELMVYNNKLYFTAHNGSGIRLWQYDGSTASIATNMTSTYSVSDLVIYNNKILCAASDGSTGKELWQYDGTTPSLVTDIRSGSNGSSPEDLTVCNNKLYFKADDGNNGEEVWVYDGSTTTLAADIVSGSGGSSPQELTCYAGKLYFQANDGVNGSEAWVHDGTSAALLQNIASGSAGSSALRFAPYNGKLYFAADNGTNGHELWEYTGTCPAPSAITTTNIATTSADLSWTADSTETNWAIEWKTTSNFTPGTGAEDGTADATTNTNYNLSGLTPGLIHYVYYKADCGDDLTSNWVGPVTVTTIAGSAEIDIEITSGILTITGDATANDLTLTYSGGNYTLTAGNSQLIGSTIAGTTNNYTSSITFPETGINGVTFDLLDGNDIINLSSLPTSFADNFTITDGNGTDNVTISAAINTSTNNIDISADVIVMNADGDLTTTSGSVMVNAIQSIDTNAGSSITTTSGNITLNGNATGTQTGSFVGIELQDHTITTETGTIAITANSGDAGNANAIQMLGTSSITSTGNSGAGDITINGNSDAGLQGFLMDAGSTIASADGAISIIGTAIVGNGVIISGTITATNAASITISGTNTNPPNTRRGVRTIGAAISSVNGDINIAGNSMTTGDIGTVIDLTTSVSSTGTGNISISGITNSSSDAGLFIAVASTITTNSGDITLIGENNPAIPDDIIFNGTSNTVSSASGNITITADDVRLVSVSVSSTGSLTIQPKTASGSIGLGGGTGTLNLSDADLLNIQDGFSQITIGDATNGTGIITINSVTFTDPITFAGGTIVDVGDVSDDVTASTNAVTIDGDLSPGSSPGIFQVIGNVALTSGHNFNVEIDGAITAGTDYDQLKTTGTINLSNATLSLSGSHTPANSEVYTIVDNDGTDAITGTFNGLAEGTAVTFNGVSLTISYVGGDGNDVTLTSAAASADVVVTLNSGILTITGDNNGAVAEDLEINYVSPNYLVISNKIITTSIAGATGSGSTTVTIPESSVNGVNVDLKDGTDRIYIKGLPALVNGNFTVTDGNDFDRVFVHVPINTGANDINFNTESIAVYSAGELNTTSGNIVLNANINGTQTGSFVGIDLYGNISTVTGAISITGKSGDTGTPNGIILRAVGLITSTGSNSTGAITINGSTTTNNGGADGIFIETDGIISSANGAISITGTAAAGEGIVIGGTITATNMASITINGTNTEAADLNRGIRATGGTVSSVNGDISMTGSSTHSTSIGDIGFLIQNSTSITSSGTGNISLDGTTNSTSDAGLFIQNNSTISTHDGDMLLTGENAVTVADDIIFDGTTNTVSSSGSFNTILITAQDVKLLNVSVSGGGALVFQPKLAGETITIGGGTGLFLSLTDAEIANIQNGFTDILIGNSASSTLTVQSVTFSANLALSAATIIDADDTGDDINVGASNQVTIDGNLTPGNSTGIFQVTGNIEFSTFDYNVEINGPAAGTEYDQIKIAGTPSLTLSETPLILSGSYTPNGEVFTIIDNDGTDAVIGTFDGLAEGATITFNGVDLTISYVGGDGNDVTLAAPIINVDGNVDVVLTDNILIITGDNNGSSIDDLTMTYSGLNYTLTSNNSGIITTNIAGASGVGTSTITFPNTGINGITFDLLTGDNIITLNSLPTSLTAPFTVTDANEIGVVTLNADLNTGTNNVTINAKNIVIGAAGSINTTSGDITLNANTNGTAAGSFIGINLSGDILTTTGAISLNGKSGDVSGEAIAMQSGSSILSSGVGAGDIIINGEVVSASADSRGFLLFTTGTITSAGGDIIINGIATSGEGIILQNGITATSSANITINAINTTGQNNERAFEMSAGTISTVDGDITINGSSNDDGVIFEGSTINITSTGTGNINIHGTTNHTGQQGLIFNAIVSVTTNSGNISLTGTDAHDAQYDIRLLGTSCDLNSGSGNLTLTSNQIQFGNTTLQGTGNLHIKPRTASQTIGLGGGTGLLQITDANIATIQDGFSNITIGEAASGIVTVQSATFTDNVTFAGTTIVDADDASDDIATSTNTVTIDGNLATGSTSGIFQVTGNVALSSSKSFNVAIDGATVAAAGYDQLKTVGTVNLANATLSLSGSHTPVNGETYTIVDNDGSCYAITGTFNGLAEGATLTFNGITLTLSYIGGDGNDVTLVAPTVTGDVIVTINSGILMITGDGISSSVDDLTMTYSGANYTLTSNNGGIITTNIAGVSGSATSTITFPNTGIYGVTFNLLEGDDIINLTSLPASFTNNFTIIDGNGIDNVTIDATIDAGVNDIDISADIIVINASADLTITRGTINLNALNNILINAGVAITSTFGDITINANTSGTASGAFNALHFLGSITTITGDISLTGKGGDTGNSDGIQLRTGSSIISTGDSEAGAITINGSTAVTDNGAADGIVLESGCTISSANGAISITGTAAVGEGIAIAGTVTATNAATITINGTNTEAANVNRGIRAIGTIISSVDGNISIIGNSTNSTSIGDIGTLIQNSASISSSGQGNINIEGTTNSISDAGLFIQNNSTISTNSGDLTLTGENAPTIPDDIIFDGTANTVSSTSGVISMIGQDVRLVSVSVSGGGVLIVQPKLEGGAMTIGGGAGVFLSLTDAEIASIQDGFTDILIGGSTGGILTVQSATFTDNVIFAGTTIVDADDTGDDINSSTNNITIEADLTPGNSTGIFQVMGNLGLSTNDFNVEINGTTAGTGHDQLKVVGMIGLFQTGPVLNLSGSHTPANGEVFTIIDNDGTDAIIGTLNGLAEGATLTFNGIALTISYVGGDGNDVTLAAPMVNPNVNVVVTNNILTITGDNDGSSVDDLTMTYSSPNYTLTSNNGGIITTNIAGASGDGTSAITFPNTGIDGVTFNLLTGDDVINLNSLPTSFSDNFTITDGNDNDQIFVNAPINTGTNDININTDLITINNAGELSTTTGTVLVDVNTNILSNAGSSIMTTSGNITLNANTNGTAAGSFVAINLYGSISTATGAISLNGKSGDVSGEAIVVQNGSSILSSGVGAGNITINGEVVGPDADSRGFLLVTTGTVTSAGGDIIINGISTSGEGIILQNGITATGSANITITATNTTGQNNERAFEMSAGTISTVDGDITINGNSNDDGVIFEGSTINIISTGTGNINIHGTTNHTGQQGLIFNAIVSVTTHSGNISLTGTDVNDAQYDIRLLGTSCDLNSGSGNLTLTSNQIQFGTTTLQGTGSLNIKPRTASQTIGVGGGTGLLQITDANLATIQDGFANITIGEATSGTVTIQSATFTDPVTFAGATIVDADDTGDDVVAGTNMVTIDGDLAPGSSPGIFQVTGNIALTSGDNFNVEIEGVTAGTDYDQLKVVGTVNLANVTLNISGPIPTPNVPFIIVDNDGTDAITGTFKDLTEGETILLNGLELTVSYIGGDGNDATLTLIGEFPDNDDCANATVLTVGAGSCTPIVSTYDNATPSTGVSYPLQCNGTDLSLGTERDIWFQATIPASGNLIVEVDDIIGGSEDWYLFAFTGACGSFTQIACNDDKGSCDLSPRIILEGQVPGTVIYFSLLDKDSEETGSVFICAYDPTVPDNIDCATAKNLNTPATTNSATGIFGFNNQVAFTHDDCGEVDDDGKPDLWYSILGNGDDITLSTCNTNTDFDSQIIVFSGDCSTLVCVDGNDDTDANYITLCDNQDICSDLTFASTNGEQYYILVSWLETPANSNSRFELTVSSPTALQNTVCPTETEIDAGPDFSNICGTTQEVEVSTPEGSTGSWTITTATPANSGALSSLTATKTTLTGVFGGIYTLRWTVNTAGCSDVFDEVDITFSPDIDFMNPDGSLGDGVQDCEDLCLGGDDRENSDGLGIPDDCGCFVLEEENELVSLNTATLNTFINAELSLGQDTAKRFANFDLTANAVIEAKTANYPAVNLLAGHKITLTAGFHAKQGSDFLAAIEYCRDPKTGVINTLAEILATERVLSDNSVNTRFDKIQDLSLKIQPNLIQQDAIIKLEVPTAMPLTLTLYNQQGQQLKTYLQKTMLTANTYYFQLDASLLPVGFYYLKAQGSQTVITKKMVVQR